MSAIACFMADRGAIVTGSDRAFDKNPSHPALGLLRGKGITIVRQDGMGLDLSFDMAVFSTAVEPDQPEVIRARALGIPTKTRPQYLAEIVSQSRTVAVAGTSGKSTTSGMLAFLMKGSGLAPSFIGGGRVKQFMSATNPGNAIAGSSDILIIEACESDGSIIEYHPQDSVLLNIALDHHSVLKTIELFRTLIGNTAGSVVLNADDPHLREVAPPGAITFSVEAPSDFRPEDVVYGDFSTEFTVAGTRFVLPLPGTHNLYDALACIACLWQKGISLETAAGLLRQFRGLERRFDIHLNDGHRLVVDDYAHNPHKIESLMKTMRRIRERVCYIFQPHGFAPVRLMKEEYIRVFTENLRGTDHLILLPIFYAGGTVTQDVSSDALAEKIRSEGRSVEVISAREEILRSVDKWHTYVIFGARDETLADFAGAVAEQLRKLH